MIRSQQPGYDDVRINDEYLGPHNQGPGRFSCTVVMLETPCEAIFYICERSNAMECSMSFSIHGRFCQAS
jgi:hypothetical protein